jgi:spermidine synthase
MRVLARREGLFGPIRVLERRSDGARLYCLRDSVQTMVQPDGISVFGYVHAAELLLKAAGTVLLIGGGGGSLATMLARQGCGVTVIDVDPAAEELARTYFGLDERVSWLTTEPLSFIETCNTFYDAVVVDACNADGLVAPFNDADVLIGCCGASADGSLVLNLVLGRRSHLGVRRARSQRHALQRRTWMGGNGLHVRAQGPTDVMTRGIYLNDRRGRTYLVSARRDATR